MSSPCLDHVTYIFLFWHFFNWKIQNKLIKINCLRSMNQSSHTGQKKEKQADAAAVVLQWENVIFTPCTSYLTFTFRSFWIFLFYCFFLFCTCAEPNKCDVDKCDVMQSRAVRIEPGKSKRRVWKSKEYIRECKCWPHDNLRCLIFFCISFQLDSESTSLPVLNIVLWLKLKLKQALVFYWFKIDFIP